MIYCVIPSDLADELHELLRAFFTGESVEVVVDRRDGERRGGGDRRSGSAGRIVPERRGLVRRRAERRASVGSPPRRAVELPALRRAVARRIAFVELEERRGRTGEDRQTARLARLAGGGDGEAFKELYLRFYDRVYQQLVIALADRHEAQDGAQEVFTRVFLALGRYDERRGSFRAWLKVITANEGKRRLSHQQRLGIVLEDGDLTRHLERAGARSQETDPADLFDRDVLYLAERLPADQGRVLVLRYSLDLDHATIARVLGRSPDAVRKLEERARKAVKQRAPLPSRRTRLSMWVRLKPAPVMSARRFALSNGRPPRSRW